MLALCSVLQSCSERCANHVVRFRHKILLVGSSKFLVLLPQTWLENVLTTRCCLLLGSHLAALSPPSSLTPAEHDVTQVAEMLIWYKFELIHGCKKNSS